MRSLQLIVSAYLDLAENRARRSIPMAMQDWARHQSDFDRFVELQMERLKEKAKP